MQRTVRTNASFTGNAWEKMIPDYERIRDSEIQEELFCNQETQAELTCSRSFWNDSSSVRFWKKHVRSEVKRPRAEENTPVVASWLQFQEWQLCYSKLRWNYEYLESGKNRQSASTSNFVHRMAKYEVLPKKSAGRVAGRRSQSPMQLQVIVWSSAARYLLANYHLCYVLEQYEANENMPNGFCGGRSTQSCCLFELGSGRQAAREQQKGGLFFHLENF